MEKESSAGQARGRQFENARPQIEVVLRASAARWGLNPDDIEDCVASFLEEMLPDACVARADASEETMRREADDWCRRFAARRRRLVRRETSIDTAGGAGALSPAEQIPSPDAGPEEFVQRADLMSRLLAVLPKLTPNQQQLFLRRYVDQERLVDLAQELKRSPNALSKSIANILGRVRRELRSKGMDDKEVQDFMSLFDSFHSDV